MITVHRQIFPADFDPRNNSLTIDENDVVHIRRGAFFSYREFAEARYPIGSTLTVFYNPKKPKQAYVEKIPAKPSLIGIIYAWVGAGLAALGLLLGLIIP